MSIATGHVCPHCDELELIIENEGPSDVPNGSGAYHCPAGYVVRCSGVESGECPSPDITGRYPTEPEAAQGAIDALADWKPYLIGAFESC